MAAKLSVMTAFINAAASMNVSLSSSKFGVKTGTFDVEDGAYVCQGTSTKVFYPDAQGTFPVVVYAHGQGGGLEGCDNAVDMVASFGVIVIVPMTGAYGGSCSSATEYKDVLHALKHAKEHGKEQVDILGSRADWSKLAVWGYSMGGKTATRAAKYAAEYGLALEAVVASHGARESESVPSSTDTMYITSTEDGSSSPPGKMFKQYKKNPAGKKVYANLEGQGHTEPCSGASPPGQGRMNEWVARFLRCSLAGEHCDEVYGGALCSANPYKSCYVHDGSVDSTAQTSTTDESVDTTAQTSTTSTTAAPQPSSSPAPTPATSPDPSPASCSTSPGEACEGEDIKDVLGYSVDDCCKACSSTSGCGGFVFTEGDGEYSNRCWLKRSCSAAATCKASYCEAGTMTGFAQPMFV